jgi:membrane protease YdiL (CAAX protease family)
MGAGGVASPAPARAPDLVVSAWLVLAVWTLLVCGALLRPWLGEPAAVCAAFAASAALALALRGVGMPRAPSLPPRARVGSAALAFGAGAASLTAWIAGVGVAGLAVGLEPRGPVPPLGAVSLHWLSLLVLAPVFEELVYRERLLPALAPHLGWTGALVVSSALFALPHLEPWTMLASFAVGLALGATFALSRSVLPCIAYHAGLNGAAAWLGLPPARFALHPVVSALVASLLLALALGWLRRARRAPC